MAPMEPREACDTEIEAWEVAPGRWRGARREAISALRRFASLAGARVAFAALLGAGRGPAWAARRAWRSSGSALRWGAFAALLGGGYTVVREALELLLPKCEACGGATRVAARCSACAGWRAAWSAGLAGLSSAVLYSSSSARAGNAYTTPALHMLVRAAEMVLRDGCRRGVLPNVRQFSVLAFTGSCWIIMYCWFYHSAELPRVYRQWITTFADMDTRLLDALAALKEGRLRYGEHSEMLFDYCRSWGRPVEEGDPGNGFLPCSTVHPWDPHSCNANGARRFARGFVRSMGLYVPVHVVSHLVHTLAQRAGGRGTPRPQGPVPGLSPPLKASTSSKAEAGAEAGTETGTGTEAESGTGEGTGSTARRGEERHAAWLSAFVLGLPRALLGAVRSSTFLGAFIAIIWRTICACRNFLRDDRVLGPCLGSLFCGLSVAIERGSRRNELACYVAPRALQTSWAVLEKKGYVRSVPYTDIGIISVAVAVFMYYFEVADRSVRLQRHTTKAQRGGDDGGQPAKAERQIMRPTLRKLIHAFATL